MHQATHWAGGDGGTSTTGVCPPLPPSITAWPLFPLSLPSLCVPTLLAAGLAWSVASVKAGVTEGCAFRALFLLFRDCACLWWMFQRVLCVFLVCSPGPCCCLPRQATPPRLVCLGSSRLTSGCWVFASAGFSAVDPMPSYACSGSGCDLLCGRWKVRGSCLTCEAVMARTVRTWVMCC